jgi:hypothetical protein
MVVALISCDETDTLTRDEEFILAVMVLDTEGQPIEGMSVGRGIELDGFEVSAVSAAYGYMPDGDTLLFSYPNPFSGVAVVRFATAGTREVRLQVSDWQGRTVRTVLNGRLPGGLHSVQWDQLDDSGERTISGVYRFRIDFADTLDPHVYEHSDSIDCTVIDFIDPYWREFGLTDGTGFLSTRDLDLFPSLQGHGAQTAYNEEAVPLGDFFVGDTVTITVSTPSPPEGGLIYRMSCRTVLSDGPNYLEFRFVPDDSTGVFQSRR